MSFTCRYRIRPYALNFINTTITPDYTIEDICELPKVDAFKTDFISTDTHKEQKLTIVRTVLLELFKGRTHAKFSELLRQFDDFMERLNCSY